MLRGEVWWGDLGFPHGSAPAYSRPVVVISADEYNTSRLDTVVIAAVTTNPRHARFPGNVVVPAGSCGLAEESVINVTQVVACDRQRLEGRIGSLPTWLVEELDDGLRRALAL